MSKAVVNFGKAIILDAKRCNWVLERLDILAHAIKGSYVEMCGLLYEAAEGKYYETAKNKKGESFESFDEYVKERFGWADRKGDYLISIQKKLVSTGLVSKEELVLIDWSKAKELTRLPDTERTVEKMRDKWIPAAKSSSSPELQAEVNKAKNAHDIHREKKLKEEVTERRDFVLYPEQAKSVDRAIELAKKINKSDKVGHALECVCLDFYASRCEEAGVKLERILSAVGRFWDIEIVAFKYKGSEVEIVHGQKLAKKYGIE